MILSLCIFLLIYLNLSIAIPVSWERNPTSMLDISDFLQLQKTSKEEYSKALIDNQTASKEGRNIREHLNIPEKREFKDDFPTSTEVLDPYFGILALSNLHQFFSNLRGEFEDSSRVMKQNDNANNYQYHKDKSFAVFTRTENNKYDPGWMMQGLGK